MTAVNTTNPEMPVVTVGFMQFTHPANGTVTSSPIVYNPFALQVYEMTYVQGPVWGAGIERYIPTLIGTPRFRLLSGGYVRRYGNYAAFPQVASQMFGTRQLAFVPGVGNNGDCMKLTICPDVGTDAYYNTPQMGGIVVPASFGGVLSAPTDRPLIPPQFHGAPVEFAVMKCALAAGKTDVADRAEKAFDKYIRRARQFGSSYGEGDAEQTVQDPWV